ncbi:MAG: nucleotidyl transferase AbiEii/AbiGii toxin family protein [Candidatus Hydrogenedentes bacterium]|nr:nucleotidyl transferase AbiEii/AbiGii toxin family protein [Candidatus Hydrogenedentota bacterium]
MTEVLRAAIEAQSVFDRQDWKSCVIGGVALVRWGEPRETVDVDLTLLTGFGDETKFVEELLRHFDARVPDPLQFALANRVVLLRTKSGVGLDVALGALPFEESMVARSSYYDFPTGRIRTCSAEDLIVMKSFAGRTKDWADVEGIILRQRGKLDWAYVFDQLRPLADLKGAPELVAELERRRDILGR